MRRFALLAACPLLFACPTDEVDPCAGTAETDWDGATLAWAVEGCASVEFTARVLGDGGLTVELAPSDDGAWTPTITAPAGGTFDALVLQGPSSTTGESEPVLWRQGHQSWSWSGVMALEELTLDSDGVPEVGGDGDGRGDIERDGGPGLIDGDGALDGGGLAVELAGECDGDLGGGFGFEVGGESVREAWGVEQGAEPVGAGLELSGLGAGVGVGIRDGVHVAHAFEVVDVRGFKVAPLGDTVVLEGGNWS